MHFTFASSYEDTIVLSLKTGQNSTVTIGSSIGLNASTPIIGADIGKTKSAQHGWNKGEEKGKGHAKRKNLTIDGEVAPGECVTVKEVVHNVGKMAVCNVKLKISEDAQLPFTGRKKEWYWLVATNKQRAIEMKRMSFETISA